MIYIHIHIFSSLTCIDTQACTSEHQCGQNMVCVVDPLLPDQQHCWCAEGFVKPVKGTDCQGMLLLKYRRKESTPYIFYIGISSTKENAGFRAKVGKDFRKRTTHFHQNFRRVLPSRNRTNYIENLSDQAITNRR